ncbi:MFS transporter [Treponema pedis]|uniref:MFS transporter n=1 Tax=Treponema pedis TaxID=409322 RepID=A0A7S6WQA4_9SPIR|nr:MFS transporter [Treponema pedis]
MENFYPMYLTVLKFNGKQIGFIFSIISAAGIFLPGLTGIISQKKNPYWIAVCGILCGAFFSILFGFRENFISVMLLGISIFFIRSVFNFSAGNSIIVSIDADKRSSYIAVRDLFLFAGMSLGIFLFPKLLKICMAKHSIFYWNALYLFPILLLVILLYKNNTHIEDEKEEKTHRHKLFDVLKDKPFMYFLIVNILLSISAACSGFIPILAITIGFDIDKFMTYNSLFIILNSVAAFFLSKTLADKKRKTIYLIDIFIDCVPYLLFALTENKNIFLTVFLILKLKDIFMPISFSYILDIFDDKSISAVLGLTESVNNAVSIISPIIIGILWDYISTKIFLIATFFSCISGIIAWKKLPAVRTK